MTSRSAAERMVLIETRLREALAPRELAVEDEGHLHAGHAGARDGRGHFHIRIAADRFRDLPPVARHRLVYEALGDLLTTDIHALRLSLSA